MSKRAYRQVFSYLSLAESAAGRFLAVTGAAAPDIHMIRLTLVIFVENAACCLAVDADDAAGMIQRAGVCTLASLTEALTAGCLHSVGIFAAYIDVPLAAIALIVIRAIFNTTT